MTNKISIAAVFLAVWAMIGLVIIPGVSVVLEGLTNFAYDNFSIATAEMFQGIEIWYMKHYFYINDFSIGFAIIFTILFIGAINAFNRK